MGVAVDGVILVNWVDLRTSDALVGRACSPSFCDVAAGFICFLMDVKVNLYSNVRTLVLEHFLKIPILIFL